jgi:hypothetical protein
LIDVADPSGEKNLEYDVEKQMITLDGKNIVDIPTGSAAEGGYITKKISKKRNVKVKKYSRNNKKNKRKSKINKNRLMVN